MFAPFHGKYESCLSYPVRRTWVLRCLLHDNNLRSTLCRSFVTTELLCTILFRIEESARTLVVLTLVVLDADG